MINLFRTEIYKLFQSKSFWIIFFMSTFLGVAIPLDSHGYITGYENISTSFYNVCLLMVFPILLGGISFGNDFVERTINNGVCAGHSRLEIFICKVSSYFIGVNAVLLLSPIINIILNYELQRYISYDLINEESILVKTVLITSLLGMAVSSISIFIACIFRDVGKTVGISVGIYFLNVVLLNSSNDLKTNFFRFSPLAQMRLILYRPLVSNQFIEASITGIVTVIIFLTVSYLCFKKTELR